MIYIAELVLTVWIGFIKPPCKEAHADQADPNIKKLKITRPRLKLINF